MKSEARLEALDRGPEPAFLGLLSGWMQQGVESFIATQRILLDLVIRQNASAAHMVRKGIAERVPATADVVTDLASGGLASFIEAQKILIQLAERQNAILMMGISERVGTKGMAAATAEILGRGVDIFLNMQHNFLSSAGKQADAWIHAARKGEVKKEPVAQVARDAVQEFIRAQKKFLDVVAEHTTKPGKTEKPEKKLKHTELSELAREATDSFIEAQKKLLDVAGHQMNINLRTGARALEIVKPSAVPLREFTREGIKNLVDAQKALMDVMSKQRPIVHAERGATKARRPARRVRRRRPPTRNAAAAAS